VSANSKIEWCHHTFNPWWGCAKVSPGCDNCYAERDAARFDERTLWGVDAARREFGDKHWNEPLKWDRKARALGVRHRVFCASMADVFDKNAPAGARVRLFQLIAKTTNLDWLILTKRIGNASRMLEEVMDELSHGLTTWAELPWPHVWIGATVVNQEEADRDIPKLLRVPARVRFLSIKPMLSGISIRADFITRWPNRQADVNSPGPTIDWIICGGESGPHARAMNIAWAREVRDQCQVAGVPFLFKQWGEWAPAPGMIGSPGQNLYSVGSVLHTIMQDGYSMARVGKKAAGRLLDGREWNEYPEITS
jgi:protein gp37